MDGAEQYAIYRNSTASANGNEVELARVDAAVQTFDDESANPGTTYHYAVKPVMPAEQPAAMSNWETGRVSVNTTFQPDGQIGRKALSMRGDAIYNTNGSGQTAAQRSSRKRPAFRFHLMMENDGANADQLAIRGTRGSRKLRAKHFQMMPTGARRAVTAAIYSGTLAEAVEPGEAIRLTLKTKRKGRSSRRTKRASFLVTATSSEAPGRSDSVKAKVVSR